MLTAMKKAKGMGAAKEGSHEWWIQRITSIALVPLVIWLICTIARASTSTDTLMSYLESPVHAVALILFIGIGIYHGTLGMKVVIEDYVHCHTVKNTLIITMYLVGILTVAAATLTVIKVHVNAPGKTYVADLAH